MPRVRYQQRRVPIQLTRVHLVGRESNQSIAFFPFGHIFQSFEGLEEQFAVVSHGDVRRSVAHALGFGCSFDGLRHIERIIDVELKVAHDGQMVPQLMFQVNGIIALWEENAHCGDDRFGASLPFFFSRQRQGVVYHLLYFASIFGVKPVVRVVCYSPILLCSLS